MLQSDYDATGALVRVFRTEYDEHGRLARVIASVETPGPLVVYEARYDEQGRLVEERKIPRRLGQLLGVLHRTRQIRYGDGWIVERGFDDQGRPIWRSFQAYGEDGEVVRVETCWAAGEEPFPEESAFRDDGTVPDFVPAGGFEWSAKEYRGLDNLLAELFVREDGSLGCDLGYEYEYDRHGNWVSCRTSRDEPEDRRVGGRFAYMPLRREIEYDDE